MSFVAESILAMELSDIHNASHIKSVIAEHKLSSANFIQSIMKHHLKKKKKKETIKYLNLNMFMIDI